MKTFPLEMDDGELHRFLNTYFDTEEMNTLCFDLGIDYTGFTGRTLTERIQEVLALFAEQGRRPELMARVRQQRPALFGMETEPSVVEPPGKFPGPDEIKALDRITLRDLLVKQFKYGQIQTICKELQVDEKQLSAKNKPSMARDLIVHLEKQRRLADLRERVIQHSLGNEPIETLVIVPLDRTNPANSFIAAIYDHFTDEDFPRLYKSMGINPENVRADGGMTGFVNYLARRGRISELVKVLTDLKPTVPWLDVAESLDAPPPASSALAERIAFYFDQSEFLDICFDLGINDDNLPGNYHLEKVESLIRLVVDNDQMDQLLSHLSRERPHLSWFIISGETTSAGRL